MTDADPRYVAARRALLDALFAMRSHTDASVIAGAQAVYLRTGHGDLAIAPFTTDADLALNPERLRTEPLIEAAMTDAGFTLAVYDDHIEPGVWIATVIVDGKRIEVPVDLIMPEAAASGGGRRGAPLGVHGKQAARRATGLEACLVDHAPMNIEALDPDDGRSITAEVAGTAALLVAKAHKLHDRLESSRPGRIDDKDAADVLRLMQTTDPGTVGAGPEVGQHANLIADHRNAQDPGATPICEWRDPDASRGHHDFQSCGRSGPEGLKYLEIERLSCN